MNVLISLVVVISFYALILYRGHLIETAVSSIQACGGCYQSWVWLTDGWLALLFILLIALGLWSGCYLVRFMARFMALLLLFLYMVDVQLFHMLTARLYYYDVFNYFDFAAIKLWWMDLTGLFDLPLLLLLGFVLSWFLFKHQAIKVHLMMVAVLMLPMFVWAYAAISHKPIKFVHDMYIKNFLSINLQMGDAVGYSDAFKQSAIERINDYHQLHCGKGLNQKPNIILVVLESFSFYQSQLLSGIQDWTPNLDRLARQYKYHDNFFANNFNSAGGRLALLTGEPTFRQVSPNLATMSQGYFNTQRNLLHILKDNGYSSSFLGAADLDYAGTGFFMNKIGFDHVEGPEALFYNGHPRFAFKGVADEVLYQRVLNYVAEEEQPYFSMVITVSSHHPYIVPVSREKNLEKVIKYSDQAVYDFYQDLSRTDFFDNGLLILTSDHRSMTPLFEKELVTLGDQALAKVPLLIIGQEFRNIGVEPGLFQQTDLLNSLQYLIAPKHCHRSGDGNVFSEPVKPAQCVFHNRGDYRDRIDVYCAEGKSYAQVILNGDDTAVIKGQIPNQEQVIDMINVSRVAIDYRHQQYQAEQLSEKKLSDKK